MEWSEEFLHGRRKLEVLYIGDKLLDSKGNTLIVEDRKVENLDETVKVYNFQVEDFHTYYVGERCVLVHNANNYEAGKYTGNRTEQELKNLAEDPAHKGSTRPIDIAKGENEAKIGLV